MDRPLRAMISSADGRIEYLPENQSPMLKATARNPQAASFSLALAGVPLAGPDLVISLRLMAGPLRDMAPDVARRVTVNRGGPAAAAAPLELWTWADGKWFDARFHFRGLSGTREDFTITFEDAGAVFLADIRAHAHPDVMARAFEHGLVLANPSLQPYTFDLEHLYPGRRFRRLEGSPSQDAAANNGQPAGPAVTLQPRDGLFLILEKPCILRQTGTAAGVAPPAP
jgi:hypothetical protein